MSKNRRAKMRLLFVSILLFTQHSFLLATESIDAQIAKIQQASESERFRLVNKLKKQIATMNANQQARAIAKYQEQSLYIEQQANMANQIFHNNQNQQTQDREVVTPQIPIDKPNRKPQKVPTPTQKPNIPTPVQKPIVKPETIPTPKPSIPIQKPTYVPKPEPTYTPPVETPTYTKPIPVQKPTYVPKPKPTYTPPVVQPTYTKPKPVQKPTYVPKPKPTYTPPVETPTYTTPVKKPAPTITKPSAPSKGRF
jgi:hypothetical protein